MSLHLFPATQKIGQRKATQLLRMLCCAMLVLAFSLLSNTALAQSNPQRQAQLPWWTRAEMRNIGNYSIKTDLPADQANQLARHLNLMHEEYSRRLASLPPRSPTPMNVMIFKHRREYMDVLRTRFGVDGRGTGGIFFVNASGTALAFWIEKLPQRRIIDVLQHEGFHQFAYTRFGSDLPVWANEGLAEFFSESVLVNKTFIIGQSKPRVIDAVKKAIELNEHIPLRQMITMSRGKWGEALISGNASLQYHQAWSMVHFLVYGDNGRYTQSFEAYLRLINSGVESEQAFIRAFDTDDIEAFENRWKKYALAANPSGFVTALERIEFLAQGALELSGLGISPESADELQQELIKIKFKYKVQKHGHEYYLNASDPQVFLIPEDNLAQDKPIFVIEPANLRGLSRRLLMFEEVNPTPPSIKTKHLRPKSLSIRWKRNRKTGDLRYEIIVK